MHTRHLLGCLGLIVAAVLVVAIVGPSGATLTLIAVALLCPLVMVTAMWLMARTGNHPGHKDVSSAQRTDDQSEDHSVHS